MGVMSQCGDLMLVAMESKGYPRLEELTTTSE